MKKLIISVWCMCSFFSVIAQEKKVSFTGKPIVTIFANYHAGLGHANENSGFDLERSYLGYEFSVTDRLSGKVVFDIGPSKAKDAELERIAYVKNAMLSWKPGKFTLDFGLITLEEFNIQEKFWGYRYILKSFNDEYKFGSSADLGVIGKYKFNQWLTADVTFINGEGYKKLNKDNNYRYGAGVTVNPIKGVTLRGYYDCYNGDGKDAKAQQSLALFAGYQHSRFNIGAEYNKMYNSKFADGNGQSGYSIYSTVNVAKKIALFGRYDKIDSSHDWNARNDGQRILAGLQYTPIKQLKLAPNFTTWNAAQGKAESFLYLNLEFKI